MQIFLPYPDFKKSLQTLDYRRLGKQRVEAYQIIRILNAASISKVYRGGHRNHPAVKMWRGHINALKLYCETPIPKAKRSGIGKLNNPVKRRV
jgi:hypothetical protein